SVSVVLRAWRPNRPPRSGMRDNNGTPCDSTSCCRSVRPPSTMVWPSCTRRSVLMDRVLITGALNCVSAVALLTSCMTCSCIEVHAGDAHHVQREVSQAAATGVEVAAHFRVGAGNALILDRAAHAEAEAAVAPRLDDEDLDEHLRRPHVDLCDGGLHEIEVRA